ncbi:MAG: adenylate kinase [Promethearchaeota archaeon]|jgi:adenylate kinase
MKKLILFGPPGAGKGTFSGQIKKVLPDIIHISTGDIFRENLKNETPLGLKAKGYMDKGELVPDDVTIEMVRDRLTREDVKAEGFILDGFPRTISQAKALTNITEADLLLLLEVPRDLIMKRILGRYACPNCNKLYNKYTLPPKVEGICDACGSEIKFEQRSDDNEETLKNRLDAYEKNAKPIIKYYKKMGILKKVNAENTLKFTEKDIKEILDI